MSAHSKRPRVHVAVLLYKCINIHVGILVYIVYRITSTLRPWNSLFEKAYRLTFRAGEGCEVVTIHVGMHYGLIAFHLHQKVLRECSFEKCWGGGGKRGISPCGIHLTPLNPMRNLHDPPPPPPTKSILKLCSSIKTI